MNIQSTPTEFADVETSSEDYASRFSGPVGDFFLALQTKITLALLEPWPGAKVLDVGGGHGQLAWPLIQAGFQVTVAGSHPACKERLGRLLPSGSYNFFEGNLLSLPLEDRSFDIVLSFRLLPHIENWPKLIAELCRLADKAVIVDYPDIRSFNFFSQLLFAAKKAIEGNTRPFRCFSRSEVLDPFLQNCFHHPVFRPEFFLPMAVHRAVKNKLFSNTAESLSRWTGLTRYWGSPIILRVLRDNPLGYKP